MSSAARPPTFLFELEDSRTPRGDGKDLLKVYPRTQPVYQWSELRDRWGDELQVPSTRFHVFRHGETVLNRKNRISGSLNTN